MAIQYNLREVISLDGKDRLIPIFLVKQIGRDRSEALEQKTLQVKLR